MQPMSPLKKLIPDRKNVLDMHVADLAGYLLEALLSLTQMERGQWHRQNFCMTAARAFAIGDRGQDGQIALACSEAWSWLDANGLICRDPDQDADWFVATRRGREVRDHHAVRQIISNAQLPEEFLHPQLLVDARPLFLQSKFETAVFEAFKSLEVAIRTAAKLGHDLVGVQLASRAFHPDDGPLTDTEIEKGERVALMNLMTGALGSYKNPMSHRRVAISPDEARDMLMIASHLLKIVDARA